MKTDPAQRFPVSIRGGWVAVLVLAPMVVMAGDAKPVSYYHDLVPILKRSCTGCHHPGKLKGGLDLTTFVALQKGGKDGPTFKPGDPEASKILEEVSGKEPSMPKEGDPLSEAEVALLARWIREGAKDDTPADAGSFKLAAPPVYSSPPSVSSIAYSPDGKSLAVSGYHEVLLYDADGAGPVGRLVGEAPQIESVCFSSDGKLLAVTGGAPARFGEVQIWDPAERKQLSAFKISDDSLYGISFSPESDRVAFGCGDKSVRVISVKDGKELMKFDNHTDWVLGTAFTIDGKRLVSASRDRAMKLINVANGQFVDDVNKLLEGVLCLARHPKDDILAYGGDLGTPRLYRISDNQNRGGGDTARDANLVREFERQPGPVRAIAYSLDGNSIAVGGMGGEVRLYKTGDGSRVATLKGHEGAVFAIAFNPVTNQVCTAGFEGKLRIFSVPSGDLVKSFSAVPLTPEKAIQKAAK
jgi:WD40 repeat protein